MSTNRNTTRSPEFGPGSVPLACAARFARAVWNTSSALTAQSASRAVVTYAMDVGSSMTTSSTRNGSAGRESSRIGAVEHAGPERRATQDRPQLRLGLVPGQVALRASTKTATSRRDPVDALPAAEVGRLVERVVQVDAAGSDSSGSRW